MPVHIIVKDIRTIDMTIDQQVALDEALVPHASRLSIGKRNFRLRSDISSKESTLQLVYDVLRLTPFYKAFMVTAHVPEIYMQEFWATATVHQHSIRFKMNNKKHIVNLEYFREMLHIYFVYQVEHKDAKKSNKKYYPMFIKVIIHFFMTKDPSILRRNKFGAILPIELTNEDIRNSAAYKEYYVIASGAAPPKTKATDDDDDQDTDNDGDDFVHHRLSIHEEEAKDEESFDPIVQTPKNSDNEGNDDASFGLNVGGEEGQDAEDDDEELYRDVNINLEGRDSSSASSQFITSMLNPSPDAGIDSLFESTLWVDVQASTTVAPLTLTAPTLPPPRTMDMTIDQQVALDEALVPHARRLRIGKRNFRLRSDISSKESTLQLVYDVLRLTPFYKAFLDSLRLSQAQMLWGMYHKKNVDFAYYLWEDFVYQVEHKDAKKSNEKYYPRNSAAYKEYYAIALGAAPPKTKATVRKTYSSSDTTITPPTAASTRLLTLAKGKQPAKSSKKKKSSDEDDDDDKVNDRRQDAEDDDEELYRDININLEGRDSSSVSSQFVTSMLNPSPDAGIDSLFESTLWVDVQASTTVAPLTLTAPTLPPPTIPTISQVPQAPTPPTTTPSTFLQDLLNFGSLFRFDHRLKTLEANFSEFVQTNQFTRAVSSILGIVERYMDQRMNEAIKVTVQLQSDRF
nr:hypothetical protein [Tanacetum cinerariifolium]